MKRYLFLITVLSFTVWTSNAQMDFNRIAPPNPDVAALFKTTVTPVNDYSGLPNVNIPLYTVEEGDISIPISLSYATGGIQVSEESSIVGLGWALSAGGAITRTVNGIDDFYPGIGYYNTGLTQAPNFNGFFPGILPFVYANNECEFPVGNNLVEFAFPTGGIYDGDYMPDTFHYNFNGYSGTFMLKPDGEVFLINKKGIDIELLNLNSQGLLDRRFLIKTEDGMRYKFSKRLGTSFPNLQNVVEYTTTWLLTSITDVSGNEVEFIYNNEDIQGGPSAFQTQNEPLPSFIQSFTLPRDWTPGNQTAPTYSNIRGPKTVIDNNYLTKIKFDSGEVVFNYSQAGDRQDIQSHFLQSIEVFNNINTETIKKFDFVHSYFGDDVNYLNATISNGDYAGIIGAVAFGPLPHINKRLRLDKVIEDDIKEHGFEYFDMQQVPNKTSFSQDYWGFYNGASNPDYFIPEVRGDEIPESVLGLFNDADRLPRDNEARLFSLKKIIYPTKGFTEFDFELNTFMAPGNTDQLPLATVTNSAEAEAGSFNGKDFEEVLICPDINSKLYLKYEVGIFKYDTTREKPPLTYTDFQDSFKVEFYTRDGTYKGSLDLASKAHLWENYNGNSGNSNDNILNVNIPAEEWFAGSTSNNLENEHYVLRAYFDDQDGRLTGKAKITATWQSEQVSSTANYALGGGLRVKSITDRDHDGSIANSLLYNYHYKVTLADGVQLEKSYGKIKTLPNYYTDHRTVYTVEVLGPGPLNYDIEELPKEVANASSHNAFSKDAGSYVGYDQVEITNIGPDGNNGKTIRKFHNEEDLYIGAWEQDYKDDYHIFPPIRNPKNGLPKRTEQYRRDDSNYILISESDEYYQINGISADNYDTAAIFSNSDYMAGAAKEKPLVKYVFAGGNLVDCTTFSFQYYPYFSNLVQQTSIEQSIRDLQGGKPLTTKQEFKYENPVHLQRTKSILVESDGTVTETKIYYPDDITDASSLPEGGPFQRFNFIEQLKSGNLHRISEPVQIVTTKLPNASTTQGKVLSILRNEYGDFGQYLDNEGLTVNVFYPNLTLTARGATSLEPRLHYEKYDKGKPSQVRKEGGTSTTYLWGYDNTYPIAKIERATLAEIATALGTDEEGLLAYDENQLSLIDNLRFMHPEYMITTFTYDPLIGVTTVTDSRGYVLQYEYDVLNRLERVKDAQDNVVADYKYNYKGQPNP